MKKILLFISGLLFVLILLDQGLGYVLDKCYEHTISGESGGKLNFYLSLSEKPERVIAGNSRALYHIIPDGSRKNKVKYLTHNGMDISFQAGIVHLMKMNKLLPDTIFLHLDLYEAAKLKLTDIQHLKFYYGRHEYITQKINGLSTFTPVKYFFRSYRHNGKALSILINFLKNSTNPLAFQYLEPTSRDSTVTQVSFKKHKTHYLNNDVLTKEYLGYLNDIINISLKNKTTLICFTSPVFPIDDHVLAKTSKKLHKHLSEKGIYYLDFENEINLPALNDPGLWRDFEHLNLKGAQIFTSNFKEKVKGLN